MLLAFLSNLCASNILTKHLESKSHINYNDCGKRQSAKIKILEVDSNIYIVQGNYYT